MIKFENVNVMNIDGAIRGMRNPMDSWDKSDSMYINSGRFLIGPDDVMLGMKLRNAGSDHRKFLRQIFVTMDIIAPMYWWKEFDTYKVGTVRNSCSTMHKLGSKQITVNDFSIEQMRQLEKQVFEKYVESIESVREEWVNCDSPSRKKDLWYTMIQMLPSSYNQRSTVTLSYETLVNIYAARCTHKLLEWQDGFISLILSLPMAHEFILGVPSPEEESEPE